MHLSHRSPCKADLLQTYFFLFAYPDQRAVPGGLHLVTDGGNVNMQSLVMNLYKNFINICRARHLVVRTSELSVYVLMS